MIIGVVNRLDVAVRRAVLTGISQVTGKISEHNAAELETDIVEVTAHAGARPDHAEWQGGWYSLSGKSKKYRSLAEATGYGRVDGLKGANCRHDFFPVIEGVDVPLYTKEELANIDPPPFEYNGKRYTYYEATQKQRAMERAIRKTKREILAADKSGDKDRFTEKSIRLRRQREEYDKFSKSAGLLTQNERNQVVGFGRSEASRGSWAARSAQTSGNGPKGTPPSGSSAQSSAPSSISTVPLPSGNASGKYSGEFTSAGSSINTSQRLNKMSKGSNDNFVNNDWSGAVPRTHTAEEISDIVKYAQERNIRIYAPESFDGDIEILREQIDAIHSISNEYNIRQRIVISFQHMHANDFAETKGNKIKFNKLALRDRNTTIQNLNSDQQLAATDISGIAIHEMGHIITQKYGEKGIDIARKAYYNIYNKEITNDDLLMFLSMNVSRYAPFKLPEQTNRNAKHKEIIPEVLSKTKSSKSNEFSDEFIRLLKEECL